jgi:hypothetical protein
VSISGTPGFPRTEKPRNDASKTFLESVIRCEKSIFIPPEGIFKLVKC